MKAKAAAAPTIDTGIPAKDPARIAEGLSRLLADTYAIYLKTHNFHWNVTGPMFNTLHLMLEVQYTELWTATDLIAERIRSLGHFAPGTYAEFAKLSSIRETPGQPRAEAMIRLLVEDNEASCEPRARSSRWWTRRTTRAPASPRRSTSWCRSCGGWPSTTASTI